MKLVLFLPVPVEQQRLLAAAASQATYNAGIQN
jgi:hypothetical protein